MHYPVHDQNAASAHAPPYYPNPTFPTTNTITNDNEYTSSTRLPTFPMDEDANAAFVHTPSAQLPTFPMDADPSAHLCVNPLVFVHEDLLALAVQPQPHPHEAPALQWLQPQDSDGFVGIMLDPEDVVIKQEPPPSPLRISALSSSAPVATCEDGTATALRRSARLAATPRRRFNDSPTSSSSVGLTSGDDDDDDDDEDVDEPHRRRGHAHHARPSTVLTATEPVDKKEKRRQQVREASSRRRVKLKNEGEFIKHRSKELAEHMRILRDLYHRLLKSRKNQSRLSRLSV